MQPRAQLSAPLLVLVASCLIAMLLPPWAHEIASTDLGLRYNFSLFISEGFLPYRDFDFEYPPLAAPLMLLPTLVGSSFLGYTTGFVLMSGIALALMMVVIAQLPGQESRAPYWLIALSPLVAGPVIALSNTDTVASVLALGAAVLLVQGKGMRSGALSAVGAMVKLFPSAIAIVGLPYLLRTKRRAAALLSIGAGLVLVIVLGGAYLLSADGVERTLYYFSAQPVEVRSLGALGLLAWADLSGQTVHTTFHIVAALEHPLSKTIGAISTLVSLVGLGWAGLAAWRLGAEPETDKHEERQGLLLLLILAAPLILIAFSRLLSPQYLIFCLPLAAVALKQKRRLLAGGAILVLVLSHIDYPYLNEALILRQPAALFVCLIRDLILCMVAAAPILLAWRRGGCRPSATGA